MNVFQIALPMFSNDGRENYAIAREVWEKNALRLAGGLTKLGIRTGVWQDPETGHVYNERMEWYEVACPEAFTFGLLVEDAFTRFPDQVSFYTAHVGTATIISRSETAVLLKEAR